jgi:hypothetical protein
MTRVPDYIEDFIRQRGASSEAAAFEAFLAEPRIAAWVSGDAARVARLRAEFAAGWARVHPLRAPAPLPAAPPPAAPVPAAPARAHLHLLCPHCRRMQVYQDGARVECRHCGRVYEDLLDLIPVRPLGPLAYVFGEGARGWLTAAGVLLLLLLLYGVLRWS